VVHNNYRYDGEKSFVISTISSLGGKDTFLSTCYIVMAVFCSMVSLSFCSLEMQQKKKNHEKVSILHEDMRKLNSAKDFLTNKLTNKK
jgi:cytochrome c biogenesis protein ResB